MSGLLLLFVSATLQFSFGLEGHFTYLGQQQSLSPELESSPKVSEPKIQDAFFGPLVALQMLSEGENFVQYAVDQEVHINGLVFQTAVYYEFKDFVKIAVGNPESANYFTFIVGKDYITVLESVQYVEYPWVQKTQWIETTLHQQIL